MSPFTWYDVGALEESASTDLYRSRSRVNGQDRCHYGSISLSMLSKLNEHNSSLQRPNLNINALWPRLTCFSNLFNILVGFSNFRDLVNYPVPCKRSGYLKQYWTVRVNTWERIQSDPEVDRFQIYPVPWKLASQFICY